MPVTPNDTATIDIYLSEEMGEGFTEEEYEQMGIMAEEALEKMVLKGWKVIINDTELGNGNELTNMPKPVFDITFETGYVPDASSWNSTIYSNYDIQISSVIDGIAYDSNGEQVCIIDSSNIADASYLMRNNTDIIEWNSDLSSLTNGTYMFYGCEGLESFDSNLSSLTNGSYMFYDTSIKTFNSDLSSLTNGNYMFDGTSIQSFNSDLSSLTSGTYMFSGCNTLESFNSDLSSLETLNNVYSMFNGCTNLKTFNADLRSLKETCDGSWLSNYFGFKSCANLETFTSNLQSMTRGDEMFDGCANLKTFDANLNVITSAVHMFRGCINFKSFNKNLKTLTRGWGMFRDGGLETFNSDLSSLTNADYMFENCKLDTDSVKNIAATIKNVSSLSDPGWLYTYNTAVTKHISIGIANTTPNEEEIAAFNTIVNKGWYVSVNGSEYSATSAAAITTLDENGEETTTIMPYYAKPIPTLEESAEYIDSDGNYFIIRGGQFIYGDDLSTYGMFTCEADAAANMRLTKYERPRQETIEKENEIITENEIPEKTLYEKLLETRSTISSENKEKILKLFKKSFNR